MGDVHVHVPHELEDAHEGAAAAGIERFLELAAVLLLSLTTLATAWSGYHAARWSGEQSRLYARASTLHVYSQREATAAGQSRIVDLLYFDGWLDAYATGNRRLAMVYRKRFRSEFVPAFDAWIASRPFTNRHAFPGPLYQPQYKLAGQDRADALDREAAALYAEGTRAKDNCDRFILSTVFFAAVLFFAGISLRVQWLRLRMVVIGVATALLIGGGIFVFTLPVA